MEQNDFNTTQMDSRERLRTLYLQPGDVIAGNYEFVRELGRGGMGMVCLCRDLVANGRLMAVKTVPDILRHDDDAVAALTREYDNMYELRHDNIVSVRHLVKDDYRYYVVMDYAEGETLAAYLSNHRKPGEAVVLEVIRRIAAALDYAHGKGMVHRDIKPGNVMVQIDGNNVKSVKLLDFGLGLQIRKSFSRTTGQLTSGTPAYKSPEQWDPRRFGKPSFNSDQYSLVAMAYEMLSGNYPFAEYDDMETFRVAVLNDAPERIDGIEDYVNNALQKALAKKPEDRFESCAAFVKAMEKKPEVEQLVQSPKMVEQPRQIVQPTVPPQQTVQSIVPLRPLGRQPRPAVPSQQTVQPTVSPKPTPQIVEPGENPSDKTSKRWMWIVAVVALMGLLALIAGVLAEYALTVKSYQQGEDRVIEMNGVKMTLKYVKAGTFTMGSPSSEKDRYDSESQHRVTLTKDYWLGETEVTQEQYKAVMGRNPSYFSKGGKYPVETVSWKDAMAFCKRLTKAERANGNLPDGYEYTLPTEAQWEYACRAGTTTPFSFGSTLNYRANYDGNYPYGNVGKDRYLECTAEVGSYAPNDWGLYDMHGNVEEWCRDWYGDYPGGAVTDPQGPSSGSDRVIRGGSWLNRAVECRSASRSLNGPSYRNNHNGFRVALSSVQ